MTWLKAFPARFNLIEMPQTTRDGECSATVYRTTLGCLNLTAVTEINFSIKGYFHVSYRRRMNHGESCQSGKMATLLNPLFLVFKISFLPKYRVKYYDYYCKVVQWDIM